MLSTTNRWLNQTGMIPRRCICKRSSLYPLCDGSHANEPWCTQNPVESIDRLVIASPSLSSLAEWWAIKVQGQTITELTRTILEPVEEVWVLSDGVQLPLLKLFLEQIPHHTEHWVHTERNPTLPTDWIHRHDQHHHHLPSDFELGSLNPRTLDQIHPTPIDSTRIFISHAVHDEGILLPTLDQRSDLYKIDFFICSNISSQANWYSEIERHLRSSDVVWAFLSKSFAQSTFCAFEIGMARALQKRIHVFSIDAAAPPAYIQHQQLQSLNRIQSHFPWLSQPEVLTHVCTKALHETRTSTP